MNWPRVAALKTAGAFRSHLERSGIPLKFDEALAPGASSPLARPFEQGGVRVGNRFCILPMEGWDGTPQGEPSELTRRRWRNFGVSGAKLIWGGEAVAVRFDGRANPNQLLIREQTLPGLARLRETLVRAHVEKFGAGAETDLHVGLQLTHSGRFARPLSKDRPEPRTAYAHPWLDRRFPGEIRMFGDDELDRLAEDFVRAAKMARSIGFAFVDIKHCHGYLGHELLSARDRPGPYGGSFENRTRFLRNVVAGIRAEAPGLLVGVRVSVFDTVPFRKGGDGLGQAETAPGAYRWAFGLLEDERLEEALEEARALLRLLETLDVRWVCVTAGSPYYNPHVQRPAFFPPSDGYEPPEDPLRGVARQIQATALLKAEFPGLAVVGSAYSYLQEWLPHVAQHTIRTGEADFVGLGRLVLSYPELPADLLAGVPFQRKKLCRTFSDCTSGPRNGLVSGCYPLDPFYVGHPDAERLRRAKEALRV
ncbi:MAG TPA: NADH:flavin oxidoreductase [Vicinamibacteria bacterium]|nr:NADH:flavin oxidoreductase [Vicinamibacteria bacterium]